MSMNKKVLGGFVGLVMFVVAGAALAAGTPAPAAADGPSPTPTISPTISPTIVVPGPVLTASPCPDGWHIAPGTVSGDQFACIPTKTPQMIECPAGMIYVDNGCTIGCEIPVK